MNPSGVPWAVLLCCVVSHASAHLTAHELRDSVAFEPALGARAPLDARFLDEAGASVALGDVAAGLPSFLALVDYDCRDLCPITLDAVSNALRRLDLDAGRDYDVIAVGIDAGATPQDARRARDALASRHTGPAPGIAMPGWHFLTGDAADIDRLARAVGFRYRRDDEGGRFAHPSGVVLLAPDGTIARYYFGAAFAPRALRDGIVAASRGDGGAAPDRAWLLCHAFDPESGRYERLVLNTVRGIACATALALAGAIVLLRRAGRARARERQR